MTPEPEEQRERARATWRAGNFAAVAERILEVGEGLVAATDVQPGQDVLDVACGTGNATIPAARQGARVIGLDVTPELLDVARERAADAMVEVDWVEGDAMELPFEADSFDRVLSTFGHMFAPDHARTATELLRVARPGGVIGFSCWTPEGSIGDMFRTTAAMMPPPPPGFQPPPLWGVEAHVEELLGPHVKELSFERKAVLWEDDSLDDYVDFMMETFGPLVVAQEILGERSAELRAGYVDMLKRWNRADGDALSFEGEYLETVARL